MHQFPYHLVHVFVSEWACAVERERWWEHGMKISTGVFMDADWERFFFWFFYFYLFFCHLTKKTGLQVHPTTDMQVIYWVKRGREANRATLLQLLLLLRVDECWEERRRPAGGWNWKRWQMDEVDEYIHIRRVHIYMHARGGNEVLRQIWGALDP